MSTLMASLYQKKDIMSSTPTIMPAKGWISSPFGYRRYPFTGEVSLHEGLDIAGFPVLLCLPLGQVWWCLLVTNQGMAK